MMEAIVGSLLFSLAWKAPPGGRGEARAKPAPQSIPSPLVRCLVAWVAPSAVLRASVGIVGRRASLNSTPYSETCENAAAENYATAGALSSVARFRAQRARRSSPADARNGRPMLLLCQGEAAVWRVAVDHDAGGRERRRARR